MMITIAKSWPMFPNAARRASVAHVTMRVVSIMRSHKMPKCGASISNPAMATKWITPVSNGAATTATESLASSVGGARWEEASAFSTGVPCRSWRSPAHCRVRS
jgi:hypothetical protein